MKKVIVVILACAMALTACKKDESENTFYLKANVNGVATRFDLSTDTAGIYNNDFGAIKWVSYRTLIVNVYNHTQKLFFYNTISEEYHGVGNYHIVGGNESTGGQFYQSSGTLNVTSDANEVVTGTFQYDFADSLGNVTHVTEGKFRLPEIYP